MALSFPAAMRQIAGPIGRSAISLQTTPGRRNPVAGCFASIATARITSYFVFEATSLMLAAKP
jgi:hypothetical protein